MQNLYFFLPRLRLGESPFYFDDFLLFPLDRSGISLHLVDLDQPIPRSDVIWLDGNRPVIISRRLIVPGLISSFGVEIAQGDIGQEESRIDSCRSVQKFDPLFIIQGFSLGSVGIHGLGVQFIGLQGLRGLGGHHGLFFLGYGKFQVVQERGRDLVLKIEDLVHSTRGLGGLFDFPLLHIHKPRIDPDLLAYDLIRADHQFFGAGHLPGLGCRGFIDESRLSQLHFLERFRKSGPFHQGQVGQTRQLGAERLADTDAQPVEFLVWGDVYEGSHSDMDRLELFFRLAPGTSGVPQ